MALLKPGMRTEPMIAAPPQRRSSKTARAALRLAAALAAALMLALPMSGHAVAEPAYSFDTTPGKLPKTVVPLHYAIELAPDFESLKLAGVEIVDIEVRAPPHS